MLGFLKQNSTYTEGKEIQLELHKVVIDKDLICENWHEKNTIEASGCSVMDCEFRKGGLNPMCAHTMEFKAGIRRTIGGIYVSPGETFPYKQDSKEILLSAACLIDKHFNVNRRTQTKVQNYMMLLQIIDDMAAIKLRPKGREHRPGGRDNWRDRKCFEEVPDLKKLFEIIYTEDRSSENYQTTFLSIKQHIYEEACAIHKVLSDGVKEVLRENKKTIFSKKANNLSDTE